MYKFVDQTQTPFVLANNNGNYSDDNFNFEKSFASLDKAKNLCINYIDSISHTNFEFDYYSFAKLFIILDLNKFINEMKYIVEILRYYFDFDFDTVSAHDYGKYILLHVDNEVEKLICLSNGNKDKENIDAILDIYAGIYCIFESIGIFHSCFILAYKPEYASYIDKHNDYCIEVFNSTLDKFISGKKEKYRKLSKKLDKKIQDAKNRVFVDGIWTSFDDEMKSMI